MRTLVLSLFLLALNLGSAQSYFDSSVVYLTIESRVDVHSYGHHKYRMVLDSVVSDTEYYQMENDVYGVKSKSNFLFKYINGKVFYQREGNGKGSALLYDFNLKEGDTTRVSGMGASFIYPSSLVTVDSIRQVFFGGKMRKGMFVHVDEGHFPFLWIEHLGSVENGILYPEHLEFESYNELVNLCQSDSLLYWKNHAVIKSGANTCNPVFYGASLEGTEFKSFHLFPNPFKDKINFLDWEGHVVDLKLYDVYGHVVFDASVDANVGLDLSGLTKGIYWAQVMNGKMKQTQILIKE